MGPKGMKSLDMVCILFGASMPVVLKEVKGSGEFILVGDAYVHGVMNEQEDVGRAMPGAKGIGRERDFVLC